MEPREYLHILRHRWLSIVIFTLLTLAAVSAATLMMPKAYTASTRVFFAVAGDSVSALAQGSSFVEQQMASYAEVATSPKVLDKVIEQLGFDYHVSRVGRLDRRERFGGYRDHRDRGHRSQPGSGCAHCRCRCH